MDFAIIATGGKQYKVTPGQELEIEKVTVAPKGKLTFDEVLLVKQGEEVILGKPFIEGYQVLAQVLGEKKGPKVRVARFRAKSRHRRVIGHRQPLTAIKIVKIETV